MIDLSPYMGIVYAMLIAMVYALFAWKLSGEQFNETKFIRTVVISFAMSLGLSATGVVGDVYTNSMVSAFVGIAGSKLANAISEVPVAAINEAQQVVNAVAPAISQQPQQAAPQPAAQQPASH